MATHRTSGLRENAAQIVRHPRADADHPQRDPLRSGRRAVRRPAWLRTIVDGHGGPRRDSPATTPAASTRLMSCACSPCFSSSDDPLRSLPIRRVPAENPNRPDGFSTFEKHCQVTYERHGEPPVVRPIRNRPQPGVTPFRSLIPQTMLKPVLPRSRSSGARRVSTPPPPVVQRSHVPYFPFLP